MEAMESKGKREIGGTLESSLSSWVNEAALSKAGSASREVISTPSPCRALSALTETRGKGSPASCFQVGQAAASRGALADSFSLCF